MPPPLAEADDGALGNEGRLDDGGGHYDFA